MPLLSYIKVFGPIKRNIRLLWFYLNLLLLPILLFLFLSSFNFLFHQNYASSTISFTCLFVYSLSLRKYFSTILSSLFGLLFSLIQKLLYLNLLDLKHSFLLFKTYYLKFISVSTFFSEKNKKNSFNSCFYDLDWGLYFFSSFFIDHVSRFRKGIKILLINFWLITERFTQFSFLIKSNRFIFSIYLLFFFLMKQNSWILFGT